MTGPRAGRCSKCRVEAEWRNRSRSKSWFPEGSLSSRAAVAPETAGSRRKSHIPISIGPDGEPLGRVGKRAEIQRLLDGDPEAELGGKARRGIVWLRDADSWLTLERDFRAQKWGQNPNSPSER